MELAAWFTMAGLRLAPGARLCKRASRPGPPEALKADVTASTPVTSLSLSLISLACDPWLEFPKRQLWWQRQSSPPRRWRQSAGLSLGVPQQASARTSKPSSPPFPPNPGKLVPNPTLNPEP